MKRALFIPAFLFISLAGFARNHKHKKTEDSGRPPHVWLANIHTYYTSRDSILAKPELSTDSVGCRVSGFTVSLQAPGHEFYGPLYSTTWVMTESQKKAIQQYGYPNTTIFIQDIHLNCHEKDATSTPFKLMYNN